MSLVRTGVYVNTSSVAFVTNETTPRTFPIKNVDDCTPDIKGQPLMFGGDNAPGPTAKTTVNQTREVKVMTADIGAIIGIPINVEGTLTWIENDMKNGILAGARTCVLAHCSLDDQSWGGGWNTAKKVNASFSAVWTLVSGAYVDPFTTTEA